MSLRMIVLALLLFSVIPTSAYGNTQWEYKAKTLQLLGDEELLTKSLNRLGNEGWELVTCTEGRATLTCILKRPKNNS